MVENPHAERLQRCRALMQAAGLDVLLVPLADAYLNEYVPDGANLLAWLTGFTGSYGQAIIMPDRAIIFSDGRYVLQLRREVDGQLFAQANVGNTKPADWLRPYLRPGMRIGHDPWLYSRNAQRHWTQLATETQSALVALAPDWLTSLWPDRPALANSPFQTVPDTAAGIGQGAKRQQVADQLRQQNCAAAVIVDLCSIAWLFNLRAGDLSHTPVGYARAILYADGQADLFTVPDKCDPALRAQLGNGVAFFAPGQFADRLALLAGQQARILLDPDQTPAAIADGLAGAVLVDAPDPCLLPKACKNAAEQAGMREAHCRDGVALARLFCWLHHQPPGRVDELRIMAEAIACRARDIDFAGESFPAIAGAGPNGAVIHYRSTPATNRLLQDGDLFLLDSGGQYRNLGTTDVTRVLAVGTPTAEQRRHYTLVLQGHLQLGRAHFPAGTTGAQLDMLARQPLYQAGLDYDHGTGHGVGHFLNVHEGPARISKYPNAQALLPGMVLSNEPGFYLPDHYGIRIENLVLVSAAALPAGGVVPVHAFESLTLVPYARDLIELNLLSAVERAQIDAYHAQVRAMILPRLSAPDDSLVQSWLRAATAPL